MKLISAICNIWETENVGDTKQLLGKNWNIFNNYCDMNNLKNRCNKRFCVRYTKGSKNSRYPYR